MISDFLKLECPFVRKIYQINQDDFKKHRSNYDLRGPEVYIVTPEINPGYDWVIEHEKTYVTEKLDGSNVGVKTEAGRLVHVQNRMEVIDPLQIMKGKTFLIEGIINAVGKGYVSENGTQYGESLGPKLQANPYQLREHLWYPFAKARESLRYKSFEKYEKGFWPWSEWFRTGLKSIFYCRYHKIPISEMFSNEAVPYAEGVVFYNEELGSPEKPWMAKLRRDMFPWYYWNKIEIIGLEDYWLEHAVPGGMPKGYGK